MKTRFWFGILFLAVFAEAIPVGEEDFGFSGGCKKDSEVASSAEGGCKESETGTVWSVPASVAMAYAAAEIYCAKLRNGRWRGWILPRLRDIERVSGQDIAVKHFRGRIHDFYWARDYDSEDLKRTAALTSDDFADRKADETASVICTRPGVLVGQGCREKEDEYFITGDGGCLYKKSGVVYGKRHDKRLSLAGAILHCERLVSNGFDDWRLPIKEELDAVAWETGAAAHFPFEVAEPFWVQSTAAETSSAAYPTSGSGRFFIRTTNEYALTVRLDTGKTAYIGSRTTAIPYDASNYKPIRGERGPWDSYRANAVYSLDAHQHGVLCVRGGGQANR